MSDQTAIAEAFELLRKLCDPRGHDLLRALENLCVTEAIGMDAVLEVVPAPTSKPSNVVSMIGRYSTKVPCS